MKVSVLFNLLCVLFVFIVQANNMGFPFSFFNHLHGFSSSAI